MDELKAMKTKMKEVEAKHEKQVEAIHESYKKMNGLRSAEDKSKADAMRVAMDGKVDVQAIKRFSAKVIENSVYKYSSVEARNVSIDSQSGILDPSATCVP